MKAHVKQSKIKIIMVFQILFMLTSFIYGQQNEYKTLKKTPVPIIKKESTPYSTLELDYHEFEAQEKDPWSDQPKGWSAKYKKMFDFRCKEPFLGGAMTYLNKDYQKLGYEFRLVNTQNIEDSIQFLLSIYSYNSKDSLRQYGLPLEIWNFTINYLIERLGRQNFKFVAITFNYNLYGKIIEVPEAEQANDNMVYMRTFKYPAEVDVFLYDWSIDNWNYIESLKVSGDHELELYVLQKFEPRYLENCKDTNEN